jgi:primosomal protein N' (replication factor Y) (superfamily II helicase)
MAEVIYYSDILLPLSLPSAFSYIIPVRFISYVAVGKRVLVPFGKNKYYAGLVTSIHHNPPSFPNIKEIEEVLDPAPIITEHQLKFWAWLADYYMCNLGDVMDAALPNYFKLSSERFYQVNQHIINEYQLEEEAEMLYDAIQSVGQLSFKEIKDQWGQKKGLLALNKLIDIGLIEPVDIVKEKFKPRYEKFLRLNPDYSQGEKLNELFAALQKKSNNQWKALISFFSLKKNQDLVNKSALIEDAKITSSIIKAMIDKEIFSEIQLPVDRFNLHFNLENIKPTLSKKQSEVYNEIQENFKTKNVTLLRGITGSGKTEIYIQWLQTILAEGKTGLLILPEIALTQQIVSRLNDYFGNQFVVYHSLISQEKRYEIWKRVLSGELKFIVGTRSAIFLPFRHLDAVIIDEEHDNSLKQTDTHPKFNARDAMIHYASYFGTKILLGSATPSIDTYFNVLGDKYGYVELLERYGPALPPAVHLINMSDKEVSANTKSYYSEELLTKVKETTDRGEQVILFQNRRGYSPYIQCNSCGFVQKCNHCDVRLTYHTYQKILKCHYCAKKYILNSNCLQCKSSELKTRGLGTQKVEEEIQLFIPELKVVRLDIDAASSVTRIDQILNDFRDEKFNTLIGTQMVAKGLDFEKLTLIGVVQGDGFFNFIDYKNDERAFQVLHQLCGRVGRGKLLGHVYIQAHETENKILAFVLNNDWKGFIDHELENRKKFIYPPFCKLVKVTIRHIKEDLVDIYAQKLAKSMTTEVKGIVLGPSVPPISRIRNQYIQEIFIKLPRNKELQSSKSLIKSIIDRELMTLTNKNFSIDILVDV